MAKKTPEYILIERHSQPGKNGVTMWRLVFYSLDDGEIYEMTVDATFRNFRRSGWEHVVQDDCPWGAYTGLKSIPDSTLRGRPVLTADSPARIVWRAANNEQAWELVEADQRQRNPTAFERIFDRDDQ